MTDSKFSVTVLDSEDDTHGIPEHIRTDETERIVLPQAPPPTPEAPTMTAGEKFREAWVDLIGAVEDQLLRDDKDSIGDVSLALSIQAWESGEEWPSGYPRCRDGRLMVTLTIDTNSYSLMPGEVLEVHRARLRALGVDRVVVVNLPDSEDL